jgi:hypothetical protein
MATRNQGFALIELVAAVVTVGILLAVLAVGAPRSRHMAWQAGSIANLHEFAAVTASYSADYSDRFWSYSWRYDVPTPSQFPDLHNTPGDPLNAAIYQATDILRRRGLPSMTYANFWIPSVFFHHLPLADYLDTRLPMRFTVSPGDRNRQLWSNDIEGFLRGDYAPNQPDQTEPLNWRWPFASSYRVPQAFLTPDASTPSSGTVIPGSDWRSFQVTTPLFNFGNRQTSKVNFPSQKVHVFDNAEWQGAKTPVFFAYTFARVPMLFVDGSARARATSQANRGFQPGNPRSAFFTSLTYSPLPWEPPIVAGTSTSLIGTYYWTRGGIQGRDFEGDEFSTANW